jgi:hypothetical protein
MTAPAVVELSVTVVPRVTPPPGGVNVGVAAKGRTVYAAVATAEAANPVAVATALSVVAAVIVMGALYSVFEADVRGDVPSVV